MLPRALYHHYWRTLRALPLVGTASEPRAVRASSGPFTRNFRTGCLLGLNRAGCFGGPSSRWQHGSASGNSWSKLRAWRALPATFQGNPPPPPLHMLYGRGSSCSIFVPYLWEMAAILVHSIHYTPRWLSWLLLSRCYAMMSYAIDYHMQMLYLRTCTVDPHLSELVLCGWH